MSVSFVTDGVFVGNHVWFAKKGTTIPSTGLTVDKSHKPTATLQDKDCWLDMGACASVRIAHNKDVITVKAPNPCFLEDVKTVIKSITTTLNFSMETVSKLGKELAFATTLDENGEGDIGDTPLLEGWLMWVGIDDAPSELFSGNVWGALEGEGDTTFGDDFTKPSLKLTKQASPLNSPIKFNK